MKKRIEKYLANCDANQSGKSAVLSIISMMLLGTYCLIGMPKVKAALDHGIKLEFGKNFKILLDSKVFLMVNYGILGIFGMMTLFFFWDWFRSRKPRGSEFTPRELLKEANRLAQIAENAQKLITVYQKIVFRHRSSLSPKATNYIGVTRDLIIGLEKRLDEIGDLLKLNNSQACAQASQLISQPLDKNANCVDTLIHFEKRPVAVPDITPAECQSVFENLFLGIEDEIRSCKEFNEETDPLPLHDLVPTKSKPTPSKTKKKSKSDQSKIIDLATERERQHQ